MEITISEKEYRELLRAKEQLHKIKLEEKMINSIKLKNERNINNS